MNKLNGLRISLPGSTRVTTRLGFGCAGFMNGDTGRARFLKLLECAYDAGIRHFDVAPMYGLGAAEACVGEFVRRHRSSTTITTKFGIAPAQNATLLGFMRRMGKPVLRQFPGLRSRIVRGSEAILPSGRKIPFTADEARPALDASLRQLRVDHIDVYLLHEAAASDLMDDDLLAFLEQARAAGKIGAFGIGSTKAEIPTLLHDRIAYCDVLQCEWSVFDSVPPRSSSFTIYHRVLTDNFRAVQRSLTNDAARCDRWSQITGCDLRNGSELGALMLKAALECNPASIILFSSGSPEHIAKNARIAEEPSLAGPALQLHGLIQKESIPAP